MQINITPDFYCPRCGGDNLAPDLVEGYVMTRCLDPKCGYETLWTVCEAVEDTGEEGEA
jgi:reverse gyrase